MESQGASRRGGEADWSGEEPAVGTAPPNRILSFEIEVQRDGRWLIDCVITHDEAAALAHAAALLGDRTNRAVRVTRERRAPGGLTQRRVILEQAGAPAGKPVIGVAPPPDDAVWCDSVNDLLGDGARRVVGRVLRGFLDQAGATPWELLYGHRLARRLENAGGLANAAVHKIARLQAERHGLPAKERSQALAQLAAEAQAMARDAAAERRLPRLAGDDLAALTASLERFAPDPERRRHLFGHCISVALEQTPGLTAKLERALGWADLDGGRHLALVDSIAADCLGSAQTVQDLLGRRDDLGAALRILADLVAGRPAAGVAPASPLARLDMLMGGGGMPAVRLVLTDRLQQELASDRRLTRADNGGERRALEALGRQLWAPGGCYAGGGPTVDALGARSERLGIVGGIRRLRLRGLDAAAACRTVLAAERENRSEAARRGFATYLLDLVAAEPAGALAGLAPDIAASGLANEAKEEILSRIGSTG